MKAFDQPSPALVLVTTQRSKSRNPCASKAVNSAELIAPISPPYGWRTGSLSVDVGTCYRQHMSPCDDRLPGHSLPPNYRHKISAQNEPTRSSPLKRNGTAMDRERMFLVTGCVLSILGAFRMKLTRHATRFVKTGPLEACQTYRDRKSTRLNS